MPVKNRLNAILVERGISQAQFARDISIDRPYLNRICNNKQTPSLRVALKISNALNMSVNQIFDSSEQ